MKRRLQLLWLPFQPDPTTALSDQTARNDGHHVGRRCVSPQPSDAPLAPTAIPPLSAPPTRFPDRLVDHPPAVHALSQGGGGHLSRGEPCGHAFHTLCWHAQRPAGSHSSALTVAISPPRRWPFCFWPTVGPRFCLIKAQSCKKPSARPSLHIRSLGGLAANTLDMPCTHAAPASVKRPYEHGAMGACMNACMHARSCVRACSTFTPPSTFTPRG
jgi:hypothetical protein